MIKATWVRLFLGIFALLCFSRAGFSATLPTAEQIQDILMLCAGGITKEVQSTIVGKIQIWKREAEVKGSADMSTLGAVLRSVPEGQQINEKNYSTYVDCTLKQTSNFLQQESAPLTSLEMVGSLSVVEGSPDVTKRFIQKYEITDLKKAASDMADTFASYIQTSDRGPKYTVTLTIVDRALHIKDGAVQPATLHVTRFDSVRTLHDLDKLIASARTGPVVQASIESLIARPAGESPPIDPEDRDWKLRQGVYRIAVVSPLYEPAVQYVQLTDTGELEKETISEAPKPVPNEWQVELSKRSSADRSKVAVWPFNVTAVTRPGEKFDSESKILEAVFIDRLNQTGHLSAFLATKRYVIYDPGLAKGQSPLFPDADNAEFEVKAYSVIAPSPIPVATGR